MNGKLCIQTHCRWERGRLPSRGRSTGRPAYETREVGTLHPQTIQYVYVILTCYLRPGADACASARMPAPLCGCLRLGADACAPGAVPLEGQRCPRARTIPRWKPTLRVVWLLCAPPEGRAYTPNPRRLLHKVHLPFWGHGRGHRLALQNRAAARNEPLTVRSGCGGRSVWRPTQGLVSLDLT